MGSRDIVESGDKGLKVFDTGQLGFHFVSAVALFELVVLISGSFTVVPKSWVSLIFVEVRNRM